MNYVESKIAERNRWDRKQDGRTYIIRRIDGNRITLERQSAAFGTPDITVTRAELLRRYEPA